MKKAITIFFLAFYICGTLLLPMGDFSLLNDLPEVYHHCKSTEDVDMTPLDFISDHLLNIDGLFDKHTNGDAQKPHSPIQYHYTGQLTFFIVPSFILSVAKYFPCIFTYLVSFKCFLKSNYIVKHFQPPRSVRCI